MARSKEDVAERRKASQERRAAAKATRHAEQNQKILDEGGVIGEEGASKPKKKRAPVSLLTLYTKAGLTSSDDDSLLRERRRLRDRPRVERLLPSPSESPGPGSPSLPRLGSMEVKRPRVPLPREPRSPRGRRRQGSPDSLNLNSPESRARYVPPHTFMSMMLIGTEHCIRR